MSTQQYRLLNVGEPVGTSDEIYDAKNRTWIRVGCAVYNVDESPHRRPIAPTGWIEIKDRKPEFPCIVGRYGGTWITYTFDALHYIHDSWTHWLPIPPPPPQLDPAEQAWKEWGSTPSQYPASLQEAFLAGWKARGEK
jgi:hypothetical protein